MLLLSVPDTENVATKPVIALEDGLETTAMLPTLKSAVLTVDHMEPAMRTSQERNIVFANADGKALSATRKRRATEWTMTIRSFVRNMEPATMKFATVQEAGLDPIVKFLIPRFALSTAEPTEPARKASRRPARASLAGTDCYATKSYSALTSIMTTQTFAVDTETVSGTSTPFSTLHSASASRPTRASTAA